MSAERGFLGILVGLRWVFVTEESSRRVCPNAGKLPLSKSSSFAAYTSADLATPRHACPMEAL